LNFANCAMLYPDGDVICKDVVWPRALVGMSQLSGVYFNN
jgi:hypothetical protein